MKEQESKYFRTAAKMDEALIALLEVKDFEYITIREICEAAHVHRSTFYLHYENTADLLAECIQYMQAKFLTYFHGQAGSVPRAQNGKREDLILMTPAYLTPYLTYVKENRRVFGTYVAHADTLRGGEAFRRLFEEVFDPILAQFRVPPARRFYTMVFYINGIISVVMEWLKNDCREEIEAVADLLISLCLPSLPADVPHCASDPDAP